MTEKLVCADKKNDIDIKNTPFVTTMISIDEIKLIGRSENNNVFISEGISFFTINWLFSRDRKNFGKVLV